MRFVMPRVCVYNTSVYVYVYVYMYLYRLCYKSAHIAIRTSFLGPVTSSCVLRRAEATVPEAIRKDSLPLIRVQLVGGRNQLSADIK